MNVWKHAKLGWKLSAFAGAVVACVGVQALVTNHLTNEVRVPGPLYQTLHDTEVLIADVLPPPKYIIETHLLAHELTQLSSRETPTHIARLKKLEGEFLTRSEYWKGYAGLDVELAKQLNEVSDGIGREYFRIVRDELIPLVQAGKNESAHKLMEDKLSTLYARHRVAIDEVVRLATLRRNENEARAAMLAASTNQVVIGSTIIIALGGVGLSLLLARSIAKPMRDTAKAMRDFSTLRVMPKSLDITRNDELGDVARALTQLTSDLHSSEEAARVNEQLAVCEAKRANEAATAQAFTNQQLALAIEATGLCLWTWDVSTDELSLDENLLAQLGLPTLPTTGEQWHAAIRSDDLVVLRDRMRAFLHGESEMYSAEYRIKTANGSYRWLMARGKAQSSDASGKPVLVQGTHLDITADREVSEQLRAAKEAAEAANQAKSEFLANMSHELRTPLAAILGSADLLHNDGDISLAPTRRVENIEAINRSGRHLLMIINDVLDIAKIEAGKLTVVEEPVDVCEVLREVVSFVRPKATPKGLEIKVVFDSPMPSMASTDKTRLRQVLLNLASNAVKFTDSGSVTLRCRMGTVVENEAQGSTPVLIFDVTDTGIGLSSEQRERLFQAFEQADSGMSRQYGGTGLGLVISKRLSQLMGGDVSIVRSEPGKGSTFRITIAPSTVLGAVERFEEGLARESPVVPVAMAKLSGRVLLAEDGADNQRLIAHFVRKAGAVVDIAENGRVAMEMIDQADSTEKPYQLILMDMQMPECDGYTAARTLRALGSRTPIIALTAHAMPEDRAKCLAAGCNDYITKPIDRVTLVAQCAKWIQTSAGKAAA